jgi:CelD/BcsL family acetyltransferase involved in cellulose biosynthesis
MNFAFRHDVQSKAEGMAPRVARIEILDDIAAAEPLWRRLEDEGAILSPYQRYDCVFFWHRHVSPHYGTRALLVAGFDTHDNPLFLWPLAVSPFGPLTVATFFGAKHATLNLPPWRADFAAQMTAGDLNRVVAHVARAVPALDLLMLLNQPATWNGMRNPFCLLSHQRSPEDNYRVTLTTPGANGAPLTAIPRRLRKKEKHLAKLPGYRYARPSTAREVDRCLDAFFKQKAARLASLGFNNVFEKPGIANFIRAACHEGLQDGEPVIELHTLECEEELLALFAGIHDRRRYTLTFNSHTLSEHSRHSPGLILLHRVIADAATRGFEALDVGPGDARYKTFFCKEFEPIIDNVLPLSASGRVVTPFIRAALSAKSAIKRNPRVWNAYRVLRRRFSAGGKSEADEAAD